MFMLIVWMYNVSISGVFLFSMNFLNVVNYNGKMIEVNVLNKEFFE